VFIQQVKLVARGEWVKFTIHSFVDPVLAENENQRRPPDLIAHCSVNRDSQWGQWDFNDIVAEKADLSERIDCSEGTKLHFGVTMIAGLCE
jgi:hypothetical protein